MYGYTFRCRTLLGKKLLSFYIPKLTEVNNPEPNPTHELVQKLFQDYLGLPWDLSNRLAGLWRSWLLAILDSPGCHPSQAPGDHSGKVSNAFLVAFAKHSPVSTSLASKADPLALLPFQNCWIQSVKTCKWRHILSCHVFESVSYHIFQRKCRLLTHSQGTPYCRTSIFRLPFWGS